MAACRRRPAPAAGRPPRLQHPPADAASAVPHAPGGLLRPAGTTDRAGGPRAESTATTVSPVRARTPTRTRTRWPGSSSAPLLRRAEQHHLGHDRYVLSPASSRDRRVGHHPRRPAPPSTCGSPSSSRTTEAVRPSSATVRSGDASRAAPRTAAVADDRDAGHDGRGPRPPGPRRRPSAAATQAAAQIHASSAGAAERRRQGQSPTPRPPRAPSRRSSQRQRGAVPCLTRSPARPAPPRWPDRCRGRRRVPRRSGTAPAGAVVHDPLGQHRPDARQRVELGDPAVLRSTRPSAAAPGGPPPGPGRRAPRAPRRPAVPRRPPPPRGSPRPGRPRAAAHRPPRSRRRPGARRERHQSRAGRPARRPRPRRSRGLGRPRPPVGVDAAGPRPAGGARRSTRSTRGRSSHVHPASRSPASSAATHSARAPGRPGSQRTAGPAPGGDRCRPAVLRCPAHLAPRRARRPRARRRPVGGPGPRRRRAPSRRTGRARRADAAAARG